MKKALNNINPKKFSKFKFYFFVTIIYVLFVGYSYAVSSDMIYASNNTSNIMLIPSGQAVAMKLKTNGVLVVGVKNDNKLPAKNDGVKIGDIITYVNDVKVLNTNHFEDILLNSQGEDITLKIVRNDEILSIKTHGVKDETGNIVLGMWLRDSAAGIGTVSFYTADKKSFFALGHPVNDIDTNKTYDVRSGELELVDIKGAKKGDRNKAGELIGIMSDYEIGKITKNNSQGIFGKIENSGVILEQKMNVADKKDVKAGKAYIMATVSDEGVGKYEIEIVKILDNNDNKDFIIKVTDPNLIEKTGGIVQGMSGSPIIQNNKIIGAVTHVVLSEPKKGYGICVSNMLKNY